MIAHFICVNTSGTICTKSYASVYRVQFFPDNSAYDLEVYLVEVKCALTTINGALYRNALKLANQYPSCLEVGRVSERKWG